MRSPLSSEELIELVIEADEIGADLYRNLGKITPNPGAREAFERIAQEEKAHVRELERLLEAVHARGLEGTDTENDHGYLRALIEGRIFMAENRWSRTAESVSDETEAARLACSFENEIILFLYGIRHEEPEAERGTVDRLLKEQYEHVQHLHALGRSLKSQEGEVDHERSVIKQRAY